MVRYSDIVRMRKAKPCPECGKIKPLVSFYNNSATPDGHDGICKTCRKERHKKARKVARIEREKIKRAEKRKEATA